jgi:hypothetical protein
LLYHPKALGGGLIQINTCRQGPSQKKKRKEKKSRHLGLESIIYLVHGPEYVEGKNVEKDGGQSQIVVQEADVILWEENVKKTPFFLKL